MSARRSWQSERGRRAGAPAAATLDAVQVVGQRPTPPTGTIDNLPPDFTGGMVARGARVGVLGDRDYLNTPFSINSYTEKTIEDQQAVTVGDVARNDASVRFVGQTGGILDAFFIRGLPVGEGNAGEIAFDGIYGVAPNYRLFTDYIERVEVLKGPAAFLYGMSPASSIGGTVNVVPKRAGEVDITRFTADYASNLQGGAHLDIGRRYGDNREFGIRANGAYFGSDRRSTSSREASSSARSPSTIAAIVSAVRWISSPRTSSSGRRPVRCWSPRASPCRPHPMPASTSARPGSGRRSPTSRCCCAPSTT